MPRIKKRTHYRPRKPRQVIPRWGRPKLGFEVERISSQAGGFLRAGKPKRRGASLVDLSALRGLLGKISTLKARILTYEEKMHGKKITQGQTPGLKAGVRYHGAKWAEKDAIKYLDRLGKIEEELNTLKEEVEARQRIIQE